MALTEWYGAVQRLLASLAAASSCCLRWLRPAPCRHMTLDPCRKALRNVKPAKEGNAHQALDKVANSAHPSLGSRLRGMDSEPDRY